MENVKFLKIAGWGNSKLNCYPEFVWWAFPPLNSEHSMVRWRDYYYIVYFNLHTVEPVYSELVLTRRKGFRIRILLTYLYMWRQNSLRKETKMSFSTPAQSRSFWDLLPVHMRRTYRTLLHYTINLNLFVGENFSGFCG
jgi:hypothetical protein